METLENLVVENVNLIYKIANMFRNSGCDMEDLKQAGKLGLISAYQHFEDNRGVKFTTYAFPYIYGEISKYVRENKGIKVSRELTKLYYRIERTRLLLMQELYREPTIKEIADYLGMEESMIADSILSKNNIHSIDDSVGNGENDLTYHELIADKEEDIDQKIMLEDALNHLSEEEYCLVQSRYFKDLTQTEVASILGTSQVQVSRQEQKVMKKLRNYMVSPK